MLLLLVSITTTTAAVAVTLAFNFGVFFNGNDDILGDFNSISRYLVKCMHNNL